MSDWARSIRKVAFLAAGLACLLVQISAAPCSASEDMAIIVHPATPVERLTFAEMRKVFLGERQYWNSDMPVVLIVRAPVARERQVVLNKIYGMTESQFKQYWISRIFRDETTSTPKVVYSKRLKPECSATSSSIVKYLQWFFPVPHRCRKA